MSQRAAAALAVAIAVLPAVAVAHEVLHEVERGRAVAVRAYFADGEPLAYRQVEVYSPADPRIPHQKGRTDRAGWVAFVPDVPGKWRVRVIDDTGHGLDLEIEAGAAGQGSPRGGGVSSGAFLLRPLIAVAVVAAIFGALATYGRRKGRSS